MSSFLNDPEAQARYEALFGKRDRASEVKGPTETPAVQFGDGKTYRQILSERTAPVTPGFPEGAVFAEPSERLSRLSGRVRGGEPFNLSGSDPFLSNE